MRVVSRNIAAGGVPHKPLDGELVDIGRVQQCCKGVTAPVWRRVRNADFFHQCGKIGTVTVGINGSTVLVADDRVTIAGEPAVEIGANLRVNGNNAVSPGLGLQAALQVAAILGVIGKAGERQKLGNAEACIAEDQYGIGPGLAGGSELFEALELRIGQRAARIL